MQTIKKYANRKLYHTNRKRYITLDGIAALIHAGEQVQVTDNETGEDITAPILAQVALQARSDRSWPSPSALVGLIRSGGDTIAEVGRSLVNTLGGAALVDAEIARRLDRLRHEGAIDDGEYVRMRRLLTSAGALSHPRDEAADELPTRSDVEKLRAQVDALSALVEQLLEQRGGE